MALFQSDVFSKALVKSINFNLILPNDLPAQMTAGNECYNRKMKTLFLLHGYSGSSKDWIYGSTIMDLAVKYNLAVVMPSGDNSFYLDRKGTGRAYGSYVGEELVQYVRKTFGLAKEKEDTFIGGCSMGGFGALHTGLAYPDTFSKITSFSSALIINKIKNLKEDFFDGIADYHYYASVFGNLDQLENSPNNPAQLIRLMKEKGQEIPPIYMVCGTEDFLLDTNREFYLFLKQEEVKVTYEESTGAHDFVFWNQKLEPAIQWLLK